MKYQLIIFDLDGTLLDSMAHIVNCFQAAAQEMHLPVPPADVIRQHIGLGALKLLETIFHEDRSIDYSALLDCYLRLYFTKDMNATYFYPGVVETLRQLQTKGHQLAIATGKSRRGISEVLAIPELQGLFTASRSAEETASKPSPDMVFELLAETQLPAEQAVLIGDTEFDLAMANNAHIDVIAVTYGAHSRAQLLALAPLACIDRIDEVLRLV